MERNKTIALVTASLAAVAAITLGLHAADAATWHDYKGDIYAGHAYGLVVPPNAKSYEIDLAGDANATAKIATFDPAGVKLGDYELSNGLTSAAVSGPAQGRHVIYVYDLTGDGALTLRVDSDTAPPADLQTIPLVRNDISIASQDASAKLDKTITSKLDAAPVFVTLLYDGSAQDLSATVASAKGDVVTITHESGSAFSPGVWTSQSGTRTSNPGNLDGVAYTTTIHAEKFQGDMILTTLALDLKSGAPQPSGSPPTQQSPQAPSAPATKAPLAPAGSFAVTRQHAVAVTVSAGKLVLQDPQSSRPKDQSGYVNDVIAIYTPDDKVLAVVQLDSEHSNATIDLPTDGEYVLYAHAASNKAVIAHMDGATTAPTVRELTLAKEKVTLSGDKKDFVLKHAPLELNLQANGGQPGVLTTATIKNANGLVAEANDIATVQGAQFTAMQNVNRTNFMAGAHAYQASGLLTPEYVLTTTYYVRDAPTPTGAAMPPAAPNGPSGPEQPPTPPTPEQPPTPPTPPTGPAPLSAPWIAKLLPL